MTKFNKSLLTMAVVGALSLPGLATAATLAYPTGQQITFAKDLIVNNGTTIYTPNSLVLSAEAADAPRVATVLAGETVRVKVTLTNGAIFDTTADAPTLVAGFLEGNETGGGNAAIAVVGVPYYSASGQELNFEYTASGNGADMAAPDYFLTMNSFQITNLVGGLFTGNAVGAEITVQNEGGQQILAAKQTIARSVWGIDVDSVDSLDQAKTIDVGADPRKTAFAPNGIVGESLGNPVGFDYMNVGGVELDITQAQTVGNGGLTYVNNFSAVSADPEYNIVGTADIVVTVTGSDLSAFAAGDAWLDGDINCGGVTPIVGAWSNASPGVLTFTASANHAMWVNVTGAPPAPSTAFVCLAGDDNDEMEAQTLAGSLAVRYNLATQRVDPAPQPFDLLPLVLNGTTLIFQNVNPGGNSTAQSFVRFTNNNGDICPVIVDAKDDAGLHTSDVTFTLGAHESLQLNSDDLENGSTKAAGAWGNGTGKWYIRVTAECSNFKASALNRHHDGVVTDLTPEKWNGNEWLTPDASL